MDRISRAARARNMARITSRDTLPELRVRSYLHRSGLRFRLHDRDLPGSPDIVLSSRRVCVFVHGCFWHRCPKCKDGQRVVQSNRSYWREKINRNVLRDATSLKELKRLGWSSYIIWECETVDSTRLERLLAWVKSHRPIA